VLEKEKKVERKKGGSKGSVESPSLEILKTRLDAVLCSLL